MLFESRGIRTYGKIEFIYNDIKIKIPLNKELDTFRSCFIDLYKWFLEINFNFSKDGSVYNNQGKFYSEVEKNDIIKSGRYDSRYFSKIDDDKYILAVGNKSQLKQSLLNILDSLGADDIKFIGFGDDNEIIKFNQYAQKETEKEPTESETSSINPFGGKPGSSAICVLGDPGAGKSVTTLNALKQDSDHIYKLLIPTDMTSSLLLQFVRGELRLNMLSKMIIAAYKNPDKLYTILIDEFHKPLTIRRVNDELLQAISTKRYSGTRFISSDIAYELISEELLESLEEEQFSYHGNIKIPDNFGFIFLSSKPSVVVDNEDLFDRLDILYIREEDRVNIVSVEDIGNSRISDNSDKKEFKKLIKELPNSKDSLDEFIDKFNS